MSPPGIKGVLFTVKISHAELLFTETLINTLKSSEARQILDLKCLFVQSQFFMRVKNVSCNVWVTVDTEGTRMEASLSPWRLSPSEDMTGKNLKPLLQCCNVCTWMNLSTTTKIYLDSTQVSSLIRSIYRPSEITQRNSGFDPRAFCIRM